MSKTFTAISILIGTIIGAGILGIPYVVMQSGFGIGLFHIIFIAIVMIITMLYLGEIALRTKTNHHLAGYAEKYLGKKGKILMFLAFAFGVKAAVLAYLIGEGESLSFMFFNNLNYTLHFGIIFWVFLSAISYYGLKALEDGEEIGIVLIFIMVIAITVLAWNKIDISNLTYNNYQNFFLPFGVVLFAFLGFTAIPEVERTLGKDKKLMKRTIISANVIVLIVYAIFAAVVLGYKGLGTPELATLALGKPFVLLGMLTMSTSYLALSIALIDCLRYDFHLSRFKAWIFTITTPLVLFVTLGVLNLANFTKVLGIGGVVSGGIEVILILSMVKSAKKNGDVKPEYSIPYSKLLTMLLILIFIVGAVLEIMSAL